MMSFALPRKLRFSISVRLTVWYGLTLLVLMGVFASLAYVGYRGGLQRDFDRHLSHERSMLLPFVRVDGNRPQFESLNELRSVAYQTDGVFGTYVRLLDAAGNVLYHSPNFDRHDPLPVVAPEESREASMSREWEGKRLRSQYTPLSDAAGRVAGWLEVSGFEWSMQQEMARLGQALVLAILLSLALSVGGGFILARRALRPVSTLTEAANEIRAHDLGARLPTRFGVQDELTDLAETFNDLIDRLEKSFQRERRFTSNAAHELLTPLATLRNRAEVVLRRERSPEAYQEKFRQVLVDVDELIDTTRGLLQLARLERLQDMPQEPVDLCGIAAEHVRSYHDRAEAQGVELTLDSAEKVYVTADAVWMGEVIDNLVDNALKYTPGGGRVSVRIEKQGGDAVLTVADTGVGFDAAEAEQLFDRFYRADTPEVQARAGSGLGLSIVKSIVELYGGRLTATSPGVHQGSTFQVRLRRVAPPEVSARVVVSSR